MDPVSLIVTALAAGATAGLKPAAEQAVKDAYAGIKTLIAGRYKSVTLTGLEGKPASETQQAAVKEGLTDAGAAQDKELLERAGALLDAVRQHSPQAGTAIGVNLNETKAAFLRAQKITAEGQQATGLQAERAEFTGGIDLGEVHATANAGGPPPNP
jgi:hypothetical protein